MAVDALLRATEFVSQHNDRDIKFVDTDRTQDVVFKLDASMPYDKVTVNAETYVVSLDILLHRFFAATQCNLVDPASSRMLGSQIKPCMSQFRRFADTAEGLLQQLQSD